MLFQGRKCGCDLLKAESCSRAAVIAVTSPEPKLNYFRRWTEHAPVHNLVPSRRDTQMKNGMSQHSLAPVIRLLLACVVVTALALATGCGGGGSSTAAGPTPTPAPGTTSTQVRFGDAPADSVIAFEVSVSALSLTPAGGGAPIVVSIPANNRIELTHASGKFAPFVAGNLPQGTFSAANL